MARGHRHASSLMMSRQDASALTMNEIIDRIAAAIHAEDTKEDFAALLQQADGSVEAQAEVARYRRMARKAHTAFLAALDETK